MTTNYNTDAELLAAIDKSVNESTRSFVITMDTKGHPLDGFYLTHAPGMSEDDVWAAAIVEAKERGADDVHAIFPVVCTLHVNGGW